MNKLSIGLAVLVVALLATTGMYYQKYQTATAGVAQATNDGMELKNRYGQAINEIAMIQDSLNAIVLGEQGANQLQSSLATEQQLSRSHGDEALARIAVLKAGIERTKEKITELDARLKKSGVKVSGLEKMIAGLKRNVADREAQVSQLTDQVATLESQVSTLSTDVAQKQETIAQQTLTIDDKTRELGTVYYMVGSKKDLTSAGVVEARGGVLGMGKTLKPSGGGNEANFTALNTDNETVIHIPAAKAQVLSAQPPSSYTLELVDGKMELRIIDPQAFRTVKHVVIMTA